MPSGASADGIGFDQASLRRLSEHAARLKRTGQTEVRKALMKRMRLALEPAKRAVKAEASFSSRIPGAVTGRVAYRRDGVVAKVIVNAAKAPHARPINNDGKGGTFRHRVFATPANPDTWVAQTARPFIKRGGDRARPQVEREIANVLDDIARKADYK